MRYAFSNGGAVTFNSPGLPLVCTRMQATSHTGPAMRKEPKVNPTGAKCWGSFHSPQFTRARTRSPASNSDSGPPAQFSR
jgi:hypothetical protein